MLQELGAGGLIANLGEGLTGTDHAPQPSTLIQTLTPQPSTLNPQPSTLNPQPSTFHVTAVCSTHISYCVLAPPPTPSPLHPQPHPPNPLSTPLFCRHISLLTSTTQTPNPKSETRNRDAAIRNAIRQGGPCASRRLCRGRARHLRQDAATVSCNMLSTAHYSGSRCCKSKNCRVLQK